jgi:osmotically-inducible protein OsmY
LLRAAAAPPRDPPRPLNDHYKENALIQRLAAAALVATLTVLGATGCAVSRHQETMGAYVDDTTITTKVKAKFADDPTVSAMAISVDTMKGVVQLSGFAKSADERMAAERLARATTGVQGVHNDIIVKQ